MNGKHVAKKKSHGLGSFYFNYKKFCSIIMMVVVNANYECIMVDVEISGRISDGDGGHSLIYQSKSGTCTNAEQWDNAFAMADNFLKPYPQAELSSAGSAYFRYHCPWKGSNSSYDMLLFA